MSENGPGHSRKPLVAEILDMVDDHVELASLEWQYEKKLLQKKLAAWLVAGVLFLLAFLYVQVAMMHALAAFGMPLWAAGLILAFLYVFTGVLLIWKGGRRVPQAGTPFEATRSQFRQNLKWIQNIFS